MQNTAVLPSLCKNVRLGFCFLKLLVPNHYSYSSLWRMFWNKCWQLQDMRPTISPVIWTLQVPCFYWQPKCRILLIILQSVTINIEAKKFALPLLPFYHLLLLQSWNIINPIPLAREIVRFSFDFFILPGQCPLSKRFISSNARILDLSSIIDSLTNPPPQWKILPIETKCLMYVNALDL